MKTRTLYVFLCGAIIIDADVEYKCDSELYCQVWFDIQPNLCPLWFYPNGSRCAIPCDFRKCSTEFVGGVYNCTVWKLYCMYVCKDIN